MSRGRKKTFTNTLCMLCNQRKTYSRGLCSMCLRKDLYGECFNGCSMPANDSRGYCTNCVTRNFEPVKVIGRIVNNEKQKWCNRCKQVLLIEEFYPQIKGSNKRAKYCKKCNTTSSKIRVEALEYGVKNVFQTANNLCVKCFLELHNFDVDHILPRSKGGTDKVDNLQIMCRSCNRKKSDKESIDYRLPIDTDSSLVLKLIDQKNMLSRRNDGQTEESSG